MKECDELGQWGDQTFTVESTTVRLVVADMASETRVFDLVCPQSRCSSVLMTRSAARFAL